jgi:hypothetical protein
MHLPRALIAAAHRASGGHFGRTRGHDGMAGARLWEKSFLLAVPAEATHAVGDPVGKPIRC